MNEKPTEAIEPPDLFRELRDQVAWLRHYLANHVVSAATTDASGHVVNRWAAVQIPDWAVKQKLDSLESAIALCGWQSIETAPVEVKILGFAKITKAGDYRLRVISRADTELYEFWHGWNGKPKPTHWMHIPGRLPE